MIYALALLAALTPTDPVSSSSPSSETYVAPDKISYHGIGNGWTGGRTSWWIERSGRGHYDSTERGRRISIRLNVGVEGFERLRNILQPLEGIEAMPCEGGGVTDQANGGLTWERGGQTTALHLDFGCARNNAADAWTSFGEANTLLMEWTMRAD